MNIQNESDHRVRISKTSENYGVIYMLTNEAQIKGYNGVHQISPPVYNSPRSMGWSL